MSTEVRVNGKTFDIFKQVDVIRDFDAFANEARILVSEQENDNSFLKTQDEVEILLDGYRVFTGYVEQIGDSESNDSHDISYELRSITADIVDSTVPDTVKSIEDVTQLKDLVQQVVNGLSLQEKISVTDNVGATLTGEIKAGAIGQKCFDLLSGYANKAQVFLNTDGDGNIVIRKPSGKLTTILAFVPGFRKNNIITSSLSIDYTERYGKYICRSNGNIVDTETGKALNFSGEATDKEMRSTRVYEFQASVPMNDNECIERAKEEANVRRLRSFNYTCTVQGFSANNQLWEEGRIVKIRDDKKGVNGDFVIKNVAYSHSAGGEICTITPTYLDAYDVSANPKPIQLKTSTTSDTYTDKNKQGKGVGQAQDITRIER